MIRHKLTKNDHIHQLRIWVRPNPFLNPRGHCQKAQNVYDSSWATDFILGFGCLGYGWSWTSFVSLTILYFFYLNSKPILNFPH